ncbi:MAG TPA: glycosyltransferase family A protein [Anaerolineales bacterium]|nr:glycosyltransferase family A protein [Anaerolineales bacterium]HLO30389.1 glycosyltransferase family A protein [Anaerolineales bacterium]
MNEKPMVSVILIFLDEEQFIREAVESVFAQSYDHWELILVDDGSTDDSTTIARCYAEAHPEKIHYLEHQGHQNRGMSASRNLGIVNAKGGYIAFLDGDDVWLPHKLEQQVRILENLPEAGMVFGPTQWWYGWTGKQEDISQDFLQELGIPPNTLLQPPELLTRFLPRESISPCTCSVLLRREIVDQVGRFEEIFKGLYEDQAFFAKVALTTPIFISSSPAAKYRQHSDSNCSIAEKNGQYRAARTVFLNWLTNYLKSQDYHNQEVWPVLRREMRSMRPSIFDRLYELARAGLPGRVYRSLRRLKLRWYALPILRHLRLLQLRRLQPIGNGRQRGTPIVRYYWDLFLQQHKTDIHGAVLEIGTTTTVRQYGGANIIRADAIDLTAHSSEVTVVSDLSRADAVPSNGYHCFVNQFTTHLIYDIEAALYHSIRILKPGGVLLINFPCLDYYFPRGLDMGTGEPLYMYRWFTPIEVENLLRHLGLRASDYSLECYGNLFTRVAYQMNLPAEELTQRELTFADAGHPLLICARVVKPENWRAAKPDYRTPWMPALKPAQWNPETGHYANR